MRAYRSLGAFACVGKCRSYGAQSAFVCVYPGFHIGLCSHSTLGFAGVPPLQGSFHSFICVYPGFHIGLCPHSTLGFAGVPPLQGSFHSFICVYPGFHIGLCPHSTLGYAGVPPLQGSFHSFICVYPGFHIGLCPHFTLGYAGVSPLQGSLSYWAFAVLCRGIVFVKCVWACQWIVAFVRSCICLILIVWVVVRDCLGGVIGAVGQ